MAVNQDSLIPPVIFFVWLGGDLPVERKTTIETWKQQNPSFTIEIWADSLWKDPTGKTENGYRNIQNWAQTKDIQMHDVRQLRGCSSLYYLKEMGQQPRGEEDTPWTNFGTSSDLVRYYRLFEGGGIYADSDLSFHKENTAQNKLAPIDLIQLNTRIHDAGPDGNTELKAFLHQRDLQTISRLTNDLMASSANNPVIEALIEYCYSQFNSLYKDASRLKEYPIGGSLMSPRSIETQMTTGPETVRSFFLTVYPSQIKQKVQAKNIAYYYPALYLPSGSSEGSDQSWNK